MHSAKLKLLSLPMIIMTAMPAFAADIPAAGTLVDTRDPCQFQATGTSILERVHKAQNMVDYWTKALESEQGILKHWIAKHAANPDLGYDYKVKEFEASVARIAQKLEAARAELAAAEAAYRKCEAERASSVGGAVAPTRPNTAPAPAPTAGIIGLAPTFKPNGAVAPVTAAPAPVISVAPAGTTTAPAPAPVDTTILRQ